MSQKIRKRASLIIKSNAFPNKIRRLVREELVTKFRKVNNELPDYGLQGLSQILDPTKPIIFRFVWSCFLAGCLAVCSFQIYTRFAYYRSEPVAVDVKMVEWNEQGFPSTSVGNLDQEGMMSFIKEMGGELKEYECLGPTLRVLKMSKGQDVMRVWNSFNATKTIIGVKVETRRKTEYKLKHTAGYNFFGVYSKFEIDFAFPYDGVMAVYTIHVRNPVGICNASQLCGTIQPIGAPTDLRTAWSFSAVSTLDFTLTLKKYEFVSRRGDPCLDMKAHLQCKNDCIIAKFKEFPCRFPFISEETLLPTCIIGNDTLELYQRAIVTLMGINCKCPRSCHETTYNMGMNYVQENKERETIMRIYYEHNRMTVITERFAYDLISLMSDTGGNLGLCLGLSLLSIFQLLQGIIGKFKSYVNRRQHPPKPSFKFRADPVFRQVTRLIDAEFQRRPFNKTFVSVNSSVPGLSILLDSSAPLIWRVSWLLVIVGCLAYSAMFVYIRILSYLSDHTRMTMEVTKNDTVRFPTVTICGYSQKLINFLRILAKKNRKFRRTSFSAKMPDWCPLKLVNLLDIPVPGTTAEYFWKESSILAELTNTQDLWEEILGVSFSANASFNEIYLPEGTCVQFNPGYQTFLGSSTQFFRMTTSRAWDTYAPQMMECERNYFYAYITLPDSPFHLNTRVTYPYNALSMFVLEYQKTTYLDRPQKPCATTRKANECHNRCFEKIFLQANITCRLPYMPYIANMSTCDSSQNAFEAEAAYMNFALPFDPLNYKECNCTRRCEEIIATFFPYTEPQYIGFTLFIVTFFTNIQQHMIEVRTDSLSSVICDIGGNLGLALGVSLLSVFDMIQSLVTSAFQSLVGYMPSKRRKKQPAKNRKQHRLPHIH